MRFFSFFIPRFLKNVANELLSFSAWQILINPLL